MAASKKGGWSMDSGSSNVKIDLSQKTTKKQNNIWDLQEEEVVEIPDIEDEAFEKTKNKVIGSLPAALTKVQDLTELYQNVKQVSLPPSEDDIDLTPLIATLRPPDELVEKDEQWEFVQLKTEIYEIVNNFYADMGMIKEVKDGA